MRQKIEFSISESGEMLSAYDEKDNYIDSYPKKYILDKCTESQEKRINKLNRSNIDTQEVYLRIDDEVLAYAKKKARADKLKGINYV